MNPIGQIRLRCMGDLLPAGSKSSPVETTSNPIDCVDLTADSCTTPVTKRGQKENRTKRTQSKASIVKPKKENTTQTKLDTFFKLGTNVNMAPRKIKELPMKRDDITSVIIAKPGRELKKKTSRRKLIKAENESASTEIKKLNDTPPTVLPEVIDLCCSDSDAEEVKSEQIKVPQRPLTVNSEKSICPSYKVVEGTTFAVDGFKYGRIEGVTVYFLTHFHADHYIGLSGKFSMPIYMSKITANLLREFIPVDEKLINIILVNTTITIDGVQVTAIDANHCPGAVMLLFQLPCGKRILHTGDFRASLDMELDPHLIQRSIDILYLDTTYISNRYSFQPQTKSISDAIQLIRDFREKHGRKRILYVCGAYLVGKEKFWSQIAKAFDFKVWTDDKRRKVLRAIDNDEILQRLVPTARQADLHVISLMKVGYKGIYEYWKEFSDTYDVLFAIRPSGWEKNSKPQYRGEVNIVGIEYSEHSSHDEMRRFVGFLKPNEVISTVPSGKDLTKCSTVPLSWYRKECFSPIKKQASICNYLEVRHRE